MTMRAPLSDLPVVLENVSVLAAETAILDDISLHFSAGSPTFLIGPNGSGKTTLIRAAMGLIAPARGRITWGGRTQVPPLRRAIVFQRPTMLRRSAAGNILYALACAGVSRGRRPARVEELLDLVGLKGLGGRPARKLSGGEQQRLALARALAKEPDILFLDEPSASLDPAATNALEDIIRQVAQRGIKVVMASHDMAQVRRLAGEVVMLHRGHLVETAPAEAFFTQPKTQEACRFVAGELLL
jgi:tungstate transport system ATP-binding protein